MPYCFLQIFQTLVGRITNSYFLTISQFGFLKYH